MDSRHLYVHYVTRGVGINGNCIAIRFSYSDERYVLTERGILAAVLVDDDGIASGLRRGEYSLRGSGKEGIVRTVYPLITCPCFFGRKRISCCRNARVYGNDIKNDHTVAAGKARQGIPESSRGCVCYSV